MNPTKDETPGLVERIRREHPQQGPYCRGCGDPWPCDPAQAANTIESLHKERERLRTALERADELLNVLSRQPLKEQETR